MDVKGEIPEEVKAREESKWKKRVFDVIQELTDTTHDSRLAAVLPYLDCSSWDEVVEERYLANVCGLPTCSRRVEHSQTHKYHIDRKSNKIYETCKERSKFCEDGCFDASVAIRVQLDLQPLWITGEVPKRMDKKYVVEKPKRLVEELPEGGRTSPSKGKPRKAPPSPYSVEIVGDNMLAAMNSLKIAERDGSSEEEDNYDEEMRQEALKRHSESDDEMVTKKKKEDKEFVDSLRRFITEKPTSSTEPKAPKEAIIPTPSNVISKPLKASTTLNLNSSEKEKLARIRQKYARKEQIRAPIVIEAPALSIRKVKETNKAEAVPTKEEIGADGEKVAVPAPKQGPIVGDPSLLVTPCTSEDADFVIKIMKEWWSERSRSLLVTGGLRPSNDIDRIMRLFLAGDKGGDIHLEDVELPELGVENVAKRRLQILINTLKPTWQLMERRLAMNSSEVFSLTSLLGTFRLTAENIANFDRQHIRLITAILFRIVCRFTESLEESYFPGGFLSREICAFLDFCGVEEPLFSFVCDEVLRLTA